ncbi:MAG: hypothetical protein OXI52_00025, partial [Caldilineaceae bacterium]|nr:hypothetical protein [Caldilineaceae bacterium]
MAAVAEYDKLLLARRSAGARPGLTVESVSWACESRHKASPYGEYVGLAGRGLAKLFRLGTCYDRDTRSARRVVGEGALGGGGPPPNGGPKMPP